MTQHPQGTTAADRRFPNNRFARGINPWQFTWHLTAMVFTCFAPFCFSWQGLTAFLVLYWVTASLGVCLGFHRLLSHRSFQTSKPTLWFFALLGCLSGQGSVIQWVATHRKHHRHSDRDEDPHSPRHGKLWSHMLWLMPYHSFSDVERLKRKWTPDLMKDPVLRAMDKCFVLFHIAAGIALYCLGYVIGGPAIAWSMLIWGFFVRMVFVYHVTFFVNSASHLWGYRNYDTDDDSRNLWWVGLLAWGEGWHNNHHAYQRLARAGHKWWEIDLTYAFILGLEKVGLVWKVVKETPHTAKTLTLFAAKRAL